MKYKITEIEKSAEVEGKFGPQIRTTFKVEGNENSLSAFSKYPLVVGAEIDGNIVQNGQWWNFKFAPKTFETKASPSFQPSGDLLRVERKLDDILTKYGLIQGTLSDMKGVLSDILSKLPQEEQF